MSEPLQPPAACPSIRVTMMPRDTNVHDTIFGGVLLSQIDLAGAIHCRHQEGCERVLTIAMKEVEFKKPVFVGDVVSYYGETIKVGNTSVTVKVMVWAHRFSDPTEVVYVTDATVTYVNVDKDRRPRPIPR